MMSEDNTYETPEHDRAEETPVGIWHQTVGGRLLRAGDEMRELSSRMDAVTQRLARLEAEDKVRESTRRQTLLDAHYALWSAGHKDAAEIVRGMLRQATRP